MTGRPIPVAYLHEHAEISGGETSLLLLWEHLDRARVRPILVGPSQGPLADRARALDVPCHPATFPRVREIPTGRGLRQLRALRALIQSAQPEILHGNTPHSNLAAALAGRPLGCRVVWHERTLPEPHHWDVDRALRFLPHRILCNSRAVARRFGGPSRKTVTIHNGVALDRFRPAGGGKSIRSSLGLAPHHVAIGMVGNFTPWKRHELFLEAAARVLPRHPQARFLIVGDEVFPENRGRRAVLQEQARRLGLDRATIFLGQRSDMGEIMQALDMLASAAEVEACSRAVLEAMASGIPVVAAGAGGNPELVLPEDTGLLFPPGDITAFAAAMERLCEDRQACAAMGRSARRRVEREFTIERQVQEIQALYDGLLR